MEKKYTEPKVEVITFESRDVITTSGGEGITDRKGDNQLPFVSFQ